eukprot:14883619-Ditylum_brightwellii.AAC.1
MNNKPLKKKDCVLMEKKTPSPSPGGKKVFKKLTQNKIMSSLSAKTSPPKKKTAPLPKKKHTPSPVARGKPPPSPVARSGCNKPGLKKKCEKSPKELMVKQMQIHSERMRDNWVQEVKEGKVKSNCPLSLPVGCITSDVNKIYEGE